MARRPASTRLVGSQHFHGCLQCHRRYPDACDTPERDSRCSSCRSGRPSIHQLGIAARDCCRSNSRLANKDDLKTYRLVGAASWWLCRTCGRQFPINPTEYP